jgi:alkylation response protein AidB-like acyl-CoA dehydrogenase
VVARGHSSAVDEPYVIDLYGDYTSKLWAVEALADAVAQEALPIHREPDAVTERARGEHEVRVAAVKARATEVALEITSGIFEATGARSTKSSLRFDRFWRNVRTHILHRPRGVQAPRGRPVRPDRRAPRADLVQLTPPALLERTRRSLR